MVWNRRSSVKWGGSLVHPTKHRMKQNRHGDAERECCLDCEEHAWTGDGDKCACQQDAERQADTVKCAQKAKDAATHLGWRVLLDDSIEQWIKRPEGDPGDRKDDHAQG